MSVKYAPAQWNKQKGRYDATMLAGVVLFLYLFSNRSPRHLGYDPAISPKVHNSRAFGACAFAMMTVILCIGPLARLDTRYLPLLYDRRHFGVMTLIVSHYP